MIIERTILLTLVILVLFSGFFVELQHGFEKFSLKNALLWDGAVASVLVVIFGLTFGFLYSFELFDKIKKHFHHYYSKNSEPFKNFD